MPLEELVLQIHVMGLDPAVQFLGRVPEPPAEAAVKAAIASLQVSRLTPLQLNKADDCISDPSQERFYSNSEQLDFTHLI